MVDENKNVKKYGDFPTNSRIKITYPEVGKPTIDFEYPDNERQIKDLRKSSSIILIAIGLTCLTIILIYYSIFFWSMNHPYYPDCIFNPIGDSYQVLNVTTNLKSNQSMVITRNASTIIAACGKEASGWIISWQRNPLTFVGEWSAKRYPENGWLILRILMEGFIVLVIYFVGIYFYGKLIAYLVRKTNFGKKNYPGFNQKLMDKHYSAEFTTCPDSLQIELPLFNNIYMDYEAEDEFSQYLTEVNIIEHDVKYIKRKGFFKKRNEKIPNVFLWKAVFKFKAKPTKGFLRINFT